MRYTKADLQSYHQQVLEQRSDYEFYWKELSRFLLPGRGVYQLYPTPQKRQLVSPAVVNNAGNEALQVFSSGFHNGLTSSSRPWVKIKWKNKELNKILPLKSWLDDVSKIFSGFLAKANFYEIIPTFYTETAGFGTGAIYMGEIDEDTPPFHLELLTVGEYAYSMGEFGRPAMFFRHIFKTYRDAYKRYGKRLSRGAQEAANSRPTDYMTIIQVIVDKPNFGKPYTSYYYEPTSNPEINADFLSVSGYYEFPVFVATWDPVGNDPYGTGLGMRALSEIKALQEHEKTYRLGVHKVVAPPVNAPAKLKNSLQTFPNGVNFYSNPDEVVSEITRVRLDLMSVERMVERQEEKIKRIFFNDLFISASRDPNRSPLKAAEVYERKDERLIRIGPPTENIISKVLHPLVERGLKICVRKNVFPLIPPQFKKMVGDIEIEFVSPLAQAQKLVGVQSINNFLGFVAGVAQFDPSAKDKVNTDRLIDEGADIYGVPMSIMSTEDEVTQTREIRQRQLQEQKDKEDAMLNAELQAKQRTTEASTSKDLSEAGLNVAESLGAVSENQGII
jgi:hypothetical protein